MTRPDTYLVVNEDDVVLARTSGPSDSVPLFNRAIKLAQDILAAQQGQVLFIDDDQGRRWGRLERIADWCWSYIPTEVK